MTLVIRERRQQQALRLSLPQRIPPSPSSTLSCSSHQLFPSPTPYDAKASSSTIGNLSDLEKLAVLGHGNGGIVYKVHHKKKGSFYALKVIRFNPITDIGTPHLEAEILRRMDSPFIVKCQAVFDNNGSCSSDNGSGDVSFVMEYMGGGSLHDILRQHRTLPEDVISCVAKHVLEGLNYLHSMHVVHGDIKPSNLLVNDKGEVKIADFGVSHVVAMEEDEEESVVEARDHCNAGTCAYMSPERIDPEGWGGENRDEFAGDVWSFGVVVLECLLGHFPLIGAGQRPDWATLMCAICFYETVEMPETASREFQGFVMRCLEKDWRKRATVKELLDHPFVNRGCCNYSKGLCDYVLQG